LEGASHSKLIFYENEPRKTQIQRYIRKFEGTKNIIFDLIFSPVVRLHCSRNRKFADADPKMPILPIRNCHPELINRGSSRENPEKSVSKERKQKGYE